MLRLQQDEQAVVADIRTKYESLSADAQSVVAHGVSWIEGNWFWVAPCLFIGGVFLGRLA